ncbi:MAG: hypothetical protein FJ388_19320, partial [Verrucomicrobia bacterium]|nr:hypothetical protein [Verrucomicrobiota bacterium]
MWWAHPCAKVFPNDPPPQTPEAAKLFAARGETESIQIVLRPKQPLSGVAATVSGFDATVRWVAYVPVKQASGPKGSTGLFPDPLPVRAPAQLAANQNQPVWITLRVPVSAKPGDYHGRVTFTANGAKLCEVPLTLHVWKFELPPTELKVMASARAGLRSQSPKDYIRNMTDHGVNTLGPHALRPGRGWQQHDEEIAFLKSLGVRNFIMPLGWVKHERHRWPENATWEIQN